MLAPGTMSLFRGDELSACRLLELPLGDCAVYTAKSPSKDAEAKNEDVAMVVQITEDRAALVIADGMGGHAHGWEAARLTAQNLGEALLNAEAEQIHQAVVQSLKSTDKLLKEEGASSGSTAVVAIIEGQTVTTHHAGDSEATLFCGLDHEIKKRVVPHSLVGLLVSEGMLSEVDALFHHERHIIVNAVGIPKFYVESSEPQELERRDTLLLACDGLHDNFFQSEISDIVIGGELLESARTLVKECTARMRGSDPDMPCKSDDLSIIMFRPNDKYF